MRFEILRNKYLGNVFSLASGTVFAQLITILVSPVVSRLYGPNDFGAFAFYASVISALGLVVTLRYEMAINLPSEQKGKSEIAVLSLIVAAIFCFGLLVVVFIVDGAGYVDKLSNSRKIWWYILPALVFLIGCSNVAQHWFISLRLYKTIAWGKILYSASNNLVILALGFWGAKKWGLFAGYLLGLSLYVAYFIFQAFGKNKAFHLQVNYRKLLYWAKYYRVLPLANTPQALTENFQFNGLIYLLKIFYDSSIVGWYSYAMRILQAPMWLIGGAISQVLYKDASEQKALGSDINRLVVRTIKLALLIAIPFALVLIIFAPTAFSVIFGERWRETGEYARILAPWLCADFIRYSVAQIPLIADKAKKMFYLTLIGSLITLSVVTFGGFCHCHPRTTLAIQSASMAVYDIIMIVWILGISKKTGESYG